MFLSFFKSAVHVGLSRTFVALEPQVAFPPARQMERTYPVLVHDVADLWRGMKGAGGVEIKAGDLSASLRV
jgi:hypothetical protein